MKITGYQIREQLKALDGKRAIRLRNWNKYLWGFPSETDKFASPSPLKSIGAEIDALDRQIARLQELQARYNLNVTMSLPEGGEASLLYLIKGVESFGQRDKQYRSASTDTGRDRYSIREMERSAGNEYAAKTLSDDELYELSRKYTRYAGQIRALIAKANTTEWDINDFDAALFNE